MHRIIPGSVVSEKRVSDSADMSVKKKIGKVKLIISEIKGVIEDCRNYTLGALYSSTHLGASSSPLSIFGS